MWNILILYMLHPAKTPKRKRFIWGH